MEENSISPVAEIPPLEENMIIDNEPATIVDDYAATVAEYKKEMVQNGLQDSDVDYLLSEYQNLEKVKKVKMHCTSCDKHIGTAPNELQNRYEHPLLKVLVCAECFQFYSSGDFEKDEDGSELYCRWCGEGGQVFCCSKCPFVFCKRCITRNLGRSMAKIISCSDNWVCFACDPSSISRFRASYWAVQKYATIMIQKAEENGNKDILAEDGNMCCLGVKRRMSTLERMLNKKPKQEQKKETWRSLISQQPEDEVICTPDILPLDEPFEPSDENPESPISVNSPSPLIPVVQHDVPANVPPMPVLQQMPSLILRPPVPKITLAELQNQMQQKYTQILLTPKPRHRFQNFPNKQSIFMQKNARILPKTSTPNNGTYRYVIQTKPKHMGPNPIKTNYTLASASSKTNVHTPIATTSKLSSNSKIENDWFDKAVVECAELTEFISSRISTLSRIHEQDSYGSDRSKADLHLSFQSYLDMAIAKISKLKRTMTSNYEKEMVDTRHQKIVNPFAVSKSTRRELNEKSDNSMSEDSNSRDSLKAKTICVTTNSMKPEEILFDMDVTCASDEENLSPIPSARTTPVNDNKYNSDSDDVQEVEYTRNNEIIQIMDSDEEEVIEKKDVDEPPAISVNVLEKIKTKFNLDHMTNDDLLRYLSPIVLTTKKINANTNEPELPTNLIEDWRNIDEKIINQIKTISEMQFVKIDNPSSTNNNDTTSTNNNSQDEEKENETINENISVENKTIEISDNSEKTGPTSDCEDNSTSKNTEEIIDTEKNITPENTATNTKNLDDVKEENVGPISENTASNSKELDEKVVSPPTPENTATNSKNVDDLKEENTALNSEELDDKIEKDVAPTSENITTNIKDHLKDSNDKKENDIEPISENTTNIGVKEEKDVTPTDNTNKNLNDVEDIEEILDSNIVLRSKTNPCSFGDEFSKFVTKFDDPAETLDNIKDSLTIAQELDTIQDTVKDIYNNGDNGSLSLPPDSITSLAPSDLILLNKEENVNKQNEVLNNQNESDVILNSEILALQQLAENCVSPVDVQKSSTECKG